DREVIAHEERAVVRERGREIRERGFEVRRAEATPDERLLAGERAECPALRHRARAIGGPHAPDEPAARGGEQELTPGRHGDSIPLVSLESPGAADLAQAGGKDTVIPRTGGTAARRAPASGRST